MATVIQMSNTGDPSVLKVETVALGNPALDQVKLKQEAIGVNFVDTMVRSGAFGVSLPAIIGFEGAGVITEVGSRVTTFTVGDRVGYFFSLGGYSSERLINASDIIKLPGDITSIQAAAFLSKGLTAWMGIRALHQLKPTDKILVQGASGAVGSILSRWAKQLGVMVIGSAGSSSKLAKVKSGSTLGLVANDKNFLSEIHKIAPSGVDVVYDFVGQAVFTHTLSAVRDGGQILAIGGASGSIDSASAELKRRGIAVKQGGTPQYVNKSTVGEASSELFAAIRSGIFSDLEIESFPLADARLVHEKISGRKLQGLPVLIP